MLSQYLLSETDIEEFPPYYVRKPNLEPLYKASIDLLERLASHELVPEYRLYLGFRYINYGHLLLVLERYDEAASNYRLAIQTYDRLIMDFGTLPEYLENLAKSERCLADVLFLIGHKSEAENGWRRAIKVREELVSMAPRIVRSRRNLAQDYDRLATYVEKSGLLDEANRHRRHAKELREVYGESRSGH
jgi:tetratricopeptide (TPR) repeat protein